MNKEGISVFVTGTAGSGKTTFSIAFQNWLKSRNIDCSLVNLDPGVDIDFEFDVDIRSWIDLYEVMEEYNLGPNGAQIACADMVALHLNAIKEEVDSLNSDYIIFDTPGQTELFSFRESSKRIVSELGTENSTIILFVYDPYITNSATLFSSVKMLAAAIELRFGYPLFGILSKTDLIPEEEKNRIMSRINDNEFLYNEILNEKGTLSKELSINFLRSLSDLGIANTIIPVSSETLEGMENVYAQIEDILRQGEEVDDL